MPDRTYPNTATCDLFQCNLDPTGLYTVYFDSELNRENTFDGAHAGDEVVTYILPLGSDFCYLAKDGIIKVNYNKDYLDSLGINYCRFKNPEFYDVYKYAFVDRIEYISPKTSALHIRIDSFVTYQFEILHNQQFIVRRTVNGTDDALLKYNYSLPEKISGTNYKMQKVASCNFNVSNDGQLTHTFFSTFKLGIIAAPFPLNNSSSWLGETNDPNYALKDRLNQECSHYLNGFPSGGNIFIASTQAIMEETTQLINSLGSEILATFWIIDSEQDNIKFKSIQITEYYIQDVTAKTAYGPTTVYTILSLGVKNLTITQHVANYGKSDSIDGYTPINKKCYNYPYNFIVASDNNGTNIEYRYEDFENSNPDFDCKFIASTDNAMVLIPKKYMGSDDTLDYSLFIAGFPQSPYMSDNYAMYLGTHAAQTAVARYARYMDYMKSGFDIAMGSQAVYNAYQPAIIENPAAEKELRKERSEAVSSLGGALQGLGNAMNQTVKAVAQQVDKYAINVYNAGATSNLATLGYLGTTIFHKYLCAHDMELLDKYFSRFGYSWARYENLYFSGSTVCPDYNYIQTQNCSIEGKIPVEDKRKIEALFDAGITIWCNKKRYGMYADSSNPNKGNP